MTGVRDMSVLGIRARRYFIPLAIVLVACSKRPPSHSNGAGNSTFETRTPETPASTTMARHKPPLTASAFCARLPMIQRRVFAAAWSNKVGPSLFGGEAGKRNAEIASLADLDAVQDLPDIPEELGQCWKTRSGAWVMLVDQVSRVEDDLRGTWAIGHVDEQGQLEVAELSVTQYPMGCWSTEKLRLREGAPGDFSVSEAERQQFQVSHGAFDWDGDGEPELLLNVTLALSAGDVSEGCIWAYRNGRVQPYEPARNLNVVRSRDVDSDGRDDLEVSVGGGHYLPRNTYRQVECNTLTLLAHSVPNGGFSLTDEVAVDHAKQSCKSPSDSLSTHLGVLCARVWGMSAQAITRSIHRGCAHRKPDSECDDIAAMERLVTAGSVPALLASSAGK